MFTGIYDRYKVPLPIPTQMLLSLSQFVTQNAILFVIVSITSVVLFWYWAQTTNGR